MELVKTMKKVSDFDERLMGYILKSSRSGEYILEVGKTKAVTKLIGSYSTMEQAEKSLREYKNNKKTRRLLKGTD